MSGSVDVTMEEEPDPKNRGPVMRHGSTEAIR